MSDRSDPFPRIVLASTDPDLPEDLPVGAAKYRDFQPIARGAKAELRACWDTLMGRRVAMKTLLPDCADDPDERRRFLREARVTAQLQHPNTVPVYEIGRHEDGWLFFTMKCIAGEDLFKVLQRLSWSDNVTVEQFPTGRVVDIAVQACQACAYAHAHGVVHRDLKPENIWVGEFGEVIVLDWGVSKVWGATDPVVDGLGTPVLDTELDQELSPLTRVGQRPGTPLYMSPEQVLGKHSIDERSDVFSMGVVLYEMLALREPFRGRTVRQTFENILHDDPQSLRESAPERGIPESLESIVLKAIAKDPAERHQSMVELIDGLESVRRDLSLDGK